MSRGKRITVELTPAQARALREAVEFSIIAHDSGAESLSSASRAAAMRRADDALSVALVRAGELT